LEKQVDLKSKEHDLKELQQRVANLQFELDEKAKNRDNLQEDAERLRGKLDAAKGLIESLSDEFNRWTASIKEYDAGLLNVVGDTLIASGFLSYAGPFDAMYRSHLVQNWILIIKKHNLPISDNFRFAAFLGNPLEERKWSRQGLPKDDFSLENAMITTRSKRCPFLVDPQNQGSKWMRNSDDAKLRVLNTRSKGYLKHVASAVALGEMLLIEDATEKLDAALNPLLSHCAKSGGKPSTVIIGDQEVEYNDSFRLVIATRIGNPMFSPDLCTKVSIVNFSVTREGLQGQLLAKLLNVERPELESQKVELAMKVAYGKYELINLENKILQLLENSKGDLLEDVDLIRALKASKATSQEVKMGLAKAETTERAIDVTREQYSPAVVQATIAYYCVNDMSKIDPMYQYSLATFVAGFIGSIRASSSTSPTKVSSCDVTRRVDEISQHHTSFVYKTISVGLFEKHKFLFSLHLCLSILLEKKSVKAHEAAFLMNVGSKGAAPNMIIADDLPPWIDAAMLRNLHELSLMPGFEELLNSVSTRTSQWHSWCFDESPETNPLPDQWESTSELQKLCILRVFRPDRLHPCLAKFVGKALGHEFVDRPAVDLHSLYAQTNPVTPVIFVLSPGVDPTTQVGQLSHNVGVEMDVVALGQGAGPAASSILTVAFKNGRWVFLANCHLMLDWLPNVERLLDSCSGESEANPKFRLWLSSEPTKLFPLTLLQRSIKVTTEPPSGMVSI
jgi:dynein heavy chain